MLRSLLDCGKTFYRSSPCRCKLIINNNSLVKNKKQRLSYSWPRYVNEKLNENEDEIDKNEVHNLSTTFTDKYKLFKDEDSPVIFDVEEEKRRIALDELVDKKKEEDDPYVGIDLKHGINGVYEIEDLVEILQREKVTQLFVVQVPKEFSYVDYLVVVTGKSPKQMLGLATTVRKIFKLKKYKHERVPKIEGETSKDWMAIDLGNIAFHIFSHEARQRYDLETLWAVGAEYDDLNNKPEEEDIMDKYKSFLKDLQPAE